MMAEIVNALWDSFGGNVYAWCGFYYPVKNGAELVLGPSKDKPACTPIGAHGVCGKAMTTRESQIIADVKTLGAAYVECDPSHKSEIAIPATDENGVVFAVLDIDSTIPSAFNDEDRRWLERIVRVLRHTPAPTSDHP